MRIFLLLVVFSCISVPLAFAEWPGTGNLKVDELLSSAKGKPMKVGLPLYSKALKIKPACATIFGERAMLYENEGVYDKALLDCEKALQLNPQNAFYYLIRARTYFLSGRYKEARDAATKARELETDAYQLDNDALRVEGASDYYLGDYKNAIECLTAGLDFVPQGSHGSADAYYFRGLSYLKWDDAYKALADFNVSLKIYPKCAKYYIARAQALKMLGKEQLAKRDLRIANNLPAEKHGLFW